MLVDLVADLQRCPSGVELVDLGRDRPPKSPWGRFDLGEIDFGPTLRYRTDEREYVRRRLENLEDLLIVRYVNARDDKALIDFHSRFGLIGQGRDGPDPIMRLRDRVPEEERSFIDQEAEFRRRHPRTDLQLERAVKHRRWFHTLLARVGSGDSAHAMQAVNNFFGDTFRVSPMLFSGANGHPQMLLKAKDLFEFMSMEAAMVAIHGAHLATCEHCTDVFLTGPMTARRSHARFCSDRCRVAAMRKRNATKGR